MFWSFTEINSQFWSSGEILPLGFVFIVRFGFYRYFEKLLGEPGAPPHLWSDQLKLDTSIKISTNHPTDVTSY